MKSAFSLSDTNTGSLMEISRLIMVVIIFVLVLMVIYVISKKVAPGGLKRKTKYMEMIDYMQINQDRAIFIVKINGKFLLLGSGSSGISKICQFSEEEFNEILPDNQDITFKEAFISNFNAKFKNRGEK